MITDARVLQPEFIPQEVKHRDGEINYLTSTLQVERYSRRGGIETAYKKIKEFASYTTSKDFGVRLFEFGFAVLLYDMWLLVDFLVQVGMDVEFRTKPRITAQRFLAYVRRRLNDFV